MNLPRKTHLKLTQKLPSKQELEDSDLIIDDEITLGRNRWAAEFGKVVYDDELSDELSDDVIVRLWIARLKALQKYDEVWGNKPPI